LSAAGDKGCETDAPTVAAPIVGVRWLTRVLGGGVCSVTACLRRCRATGGGERPVASDRRRTGFLYRHAINFEA